MKENESSLHHERSYQGLTVDALVPDAEEGRGSLRKASGSREQAPIRGYPNGETRWSEPPALSAEHIGRGEGTWGTETSKYPEEKRSFPE
jgi:hypothetical protein